jgi:hypothetical protein
MRAWLEILRERHPEVTWVQAEDRLAEAVVPGFNSDSGELKAA